MAEITNIDTEKVNILIINNETLEQIIDMLKQNLQRMKENDNATTRTKK